MAFSYSYNKQAAPDVLLGTITVDLGIAPLFLDYNLRTFDIVVYFENQLTGQQETDLNAIIANYVYIDTGNYASFNSVYTSEFSATTINSGSTNLYNIFSTIANSGETNTVSNIGNGLGLFKQKNGVDFQFRTLSAGTNISFTTGDTITLNVTNDGNDITRVQPGTNIITGGTANAPTINLVASPFVNNINFSGSAIGGNVQASSGAFTSLSATTLSGGTILSGGTNLYNIFSQTDTVTRVQPGSNIITGGTANAPTINLVASPSIDGLTLSGNGNINGVLNVAGLTTVGPLTATTTISGTTLFLFKSGVIPTVPISGGTLFVLNKAGRSMFAQTGPSGIEYSFQPSLYGNKIAYWNPPGNTTTTPGVFGMVALTATGTATARNVTTTNLLTRTKRLALVSYNLAGSLAGYRAPSLQYTVGHGSGIGGFMYVIRFGVSDSQTATRMFIGLRNTAGAPSNVEPSTLTNCIGVGNGAANTNLFIYYGGSAAQTPINLGANFPCNTNSQNLYELVLFAPPNQNNVVGYQVTRLNTGDVASGILTGTAGVALPSSTTLLAQNDFRTNNASAGAVSLDYVSIYTETDY